MLSPADAAAVLKANARYVQLPWKFVEEQLREELQPYQVEIIRSAFQNKTTASRSCHDSGKTFCFSRLAATWLSVFPDSVVITTAPTFKQVETQVWREIAGLDKQHPGVLSGTILKTRWDVGPNWYAIGVSPGDPTSIQGFHAKSGRVLVLVDEGAGVSADMFNAIEGLLTAAGSALVVNGNPTSVSGHFIEMFRNPRVHKIHISCFDTPNFKANGIRTLEDLRHFDMTKKVITRRWALDPEWAQEKLYQWGVDSPMFQSRVLGNFPDSDANSLIPLNLIDLAATEERRGLVPMGTPAYGHDIARYGDDDSVIHKRYGDWHCKPRVFHGDDTMVTAGRVVDALRDENGPYFLDITGGLGAGPYDRLRELGWKQVYGLNMSESAIRKDEFVNLRAELAWLLRDKFHEPAGIYIPDDDDLKAELSDVRYKMTSDGRRQLESKDDIKKRRNGRSPDRFDAMMMSYASPGQGSAANVAKHNMWSSR